MAEPTVTLSFDGPLATLALNRPETLNSIGATLVQDARDALARVRANRSARALILTGTGRGFCAGAELNETIASGTDAHSPGQAASEAMRTGTNPLIMDLHTLPIPVVAAVNGVAAGAGVGLALAADLVVAARSASFILTFGPKLGLVPDLGTTWQLPRRIGLARAAGLALLGDRLGAEQAEQWGLIWQCVDDDRFAQTVQQVALALARGPSHVALEWRRAMDASLANPLDAQLDYERERQAVMIDKPSFREGVAAFRAKRAPVFD